MAAAKLYSPANASADFRSNSSGSGGGLGSAKKNKTSEAIDAPVVETAAADDDWESVVREAEELAASTVLVNPPSLREALQVQMQPYSGKRKIVIFKMMRYFNYSQHKLAMLLHILEKVPEDKLDEQLGVINSYIPEKLEILIFGLIHDLTPKGCAEYLYDLSPEQFDLIINILRYVPKEEIDLFISFVDSLSWKEVISLLHHCNEPMAKHCRLCRVRRLDDLNTVVNNGQLPDHLMPITANLALLPDSKAEIWTNEEHRDFKFDWEKGIIMWKHRQTVVDLIRICNKCLDLVFGALPSINRTDPIYHIGAPERKNILYEQRDREQKRAILIGKIAIEQTRRRVREWCLRVLEFQRLAIKKINDEKKLQEDMKKYNIMIEKEKEAERNMIKKAMSVDQTWNKLAIQETEDEAKMRIMKAELNFHLPYNDQNPFVPNRENKHSWRLDPVDSNNIPISPRRALQMFSTSQSAFRKLQCGTDKEFSDKTSLTEWKNMTIASHNEYLEEQKEFERKKKDANSKYCDDIREFVDNRVLRLNRIRLRMAYQAEREEDERINRRAEDKKQRKLARIARYEEIERSLMEAEDFLSAQFRMDKWEAIREAHERDEMYNEELDQTEVDRFWGFDLYEEKKKAELDRLRQFYVNRVKQTNEKLAYAKVVNKYAIEADNILARDENALLDELARINVMKQKKHYV